MGHDISGYNKAGEEIAYARFSMGNYNSSILYSLLDANKYNAGVSGCGDVAIFSKQQIEKAVNESNRLFVNANSNPESDSFNWDQKQIQDFILNCYTTAINEGRVRVFFG